MSGIVDLKHNTYVIYIYWMFISLLRIYLICLSKVDSMYQITWQLDIEVRICETWFQLM